MTHYTNAHIDLGRETLRQVFDREPVGFSHNLSGLDLFTLASLHSLALRFAERPQDYYVAATAPSPETSFFSVPPVNYKPHEAIENLDSGAYRVLLKRPENHDHRFRDLLQTLFAQVLELCGGLGNERLVRLESGILISSAATITPFHFDPEIGFFSQIEGDKTYHVYSPKVLSETELEFYYSRGGGGIGQLGIKGRDPACEHIFRLAPGRGLHQPQNSPHWVQTEGSRSISYTFVFETGATRAAGRTRVFNHYLRRCHLNPARPGTYPALDAIKADAVRVTAPLQRRVKYVLKKMARRY